MPRKQIPTPMRMRNYYAKNFPQDPVYRYFTCIKQFTHIPPGIDYTVWFMGEYLCVGHNGSNVEVYTWRKAHLNDGTLVSPNKQQLKAHLNREVREDKRKTDHTEIFQDFEHGELTVKQMAIKYNKSETGIKYIYKKWLTIKRKERINSYVNATE